MEYIIIGVILFIAGFVALKYVLTPAYPYVSRRILSAGELKFFHVLETLIPQNLRLSLKPRLGDIIDVDELVRQKDIHWKGKFGAAIWSKHIDFVIYDPRNGDVILCIELDDASHLTPDARARDRFKDKALAATGIPLLRVKAKAFYDDKQLAKKLHTYLD